MAACEKCWRAASLLAMMMGGHTADHYHRELAGHPEHAHEPPVADTHHAGCHLLTTHGESHDGDDPNQRCDCRCHGTNN
jgi:hypothetical protein